MVIVHERMTLTTGDEPAVDRERDDTGDQQGHDQAVTEERIRDLGGHGAGTARTMALSTISITVMDKVSEAKARRIEVPTDMPDGE